MAASTPSPESAVPDVLAPGLRCVFCGINPGRVSAAAAAHFANPRNDFWRLLHDAGFTPRRFEPAEQFSLLDLGLGITNAAYRTTPGSGDLRQGDFDSLRLERIARQLEPRAVAFVGKEAYRGLFRERTEFGPQLRTIGPAALFVLPSTSPANAAVPYEERLRWFAALRDWLVPSSGRLYVAWSSTRSGACCSCASSTRSSGEGWWVTPGGGVDDGESDEQALQRELREEVGLDVAEAGPLVHEREHTFPWDGRIVCQRERFYLVRVEVHEPAPTIDLRPEGVTEVRWWTLSELDRAREVIVPQGLAQLVRAVSRP